MTDLSFSMVSPVLLPSGVEGARPQRRRGLALASRRPRKISVTVPQSVYETLLQLSEEQGRSLSSLASYWLQVQASRSKDVPGRSAP